MPFDIDSMTDFYPLIALLSWLMETVNKAFIDVNFADFELFSAVLLY